MPDQALHNPEDDPHTLIFVDILGFADFTERHPTRTVHHSADSNEYGFSGSSTTELQSRVYRFELVFDQLIREWNLYGGLPGMIFSDCAYLDGGNPLRAAIIAVSLMKAFLLAEIPVRMGIGKGTYYPFKFSTEVGGNVVLARSLFAGTAAVRAFRAEHGGGKGLRILLGTSLRDDIATISTRVKTLPLTEQNRHAAWELDYLQQHQDTAWPAQVDDWDNRAWAIVNSLDDPTEGEEVRLHYSATRDALDRMRLAHGKTPFRRP